MDYKKNKTTTTLKQPPPKKIARLRRRGLGVEREEKPNRNHTACEVGGEKKPEQDSGGLGVVSGSRSGILPFL